MLLEDNEILVKVRDTLDSVDVQVIVLGIWRDTVDQPNSACEWWVHDIHIHYIDYAS